MIAKIRKFLFQNYFRISRPMTLGSRVIATNEKGQICLIKHTYTNGWHLPGGGVEKGETTKDAAIKEAFEEAGLIVQEEDMRLFAIYANFAIFKGDHVLLYHATKWEQGYSYRPKEIAQIGFFDKDKLPEDTTKGTRRRIDEFFNNSPISQYW